MISLIVSSYQKHYFEAFSKNVEETIGVPYEIIDIWNPGKMGICEAYNLGASKAQYPYLVFCHEDILFHTRNWGKILMDQLADEKIGVVGVAGSNYVPRAPSGWFIPGVPHLERQASVQPFVDALVLDGMFLAIPKHKYRPFGDYLKGFHGYDVDFCLNVAKDFQNRQINTIAIDHFSSGNADKNYFEAITKVRDKRGYKFQNTTNDIWEYNAFVAFVKTYFKYHNVSIKEFKYCLQYLPTFTKPTYYIKILKFFLSLWRYKNNFTSN